MLRGYLPGRLRAIPANTNHRVATPATYLADLREMEERYRRSSHALHEFFFCRTLPNIRPA